VDLEYSVVRKLTHACGVSAEERSLEHCKTCRELTMLGEECKAELCTAAFQRELVETKFFGNSMYGTVKGILYL